MIDHAWTSACTARRRFRWSTVLQDRLVPELQQERAAMLERYPSIHLAGTPVRPAHCKYPAAPPAELNQLIERKLPAASVAERKQIVDNCAQFYEKPNGRRRAAAASVPTGKLERRRSMGADGFMAGPGHKTCLSVLRHRRPPPKRRLKGAISHKFCRSSDRSVCNDERAGGVPRVEVSLQRMAKCYRATDNLAAPAESAFEDG